MLVPLMRVAARGAPKLQLSQNANHMRATRFPFAPMDMVFKYGPDWLVKDRVWFAFAHHRFAVAVGAAVFMTWHWPYVGADYEHTYKSMRYLRRRQAMEASGELERNLRIKRTDFYLPQEIDNDPNY